MATQWTLPQGDLFARLPFAALVKAAIDGRLPRGFGVKRLMDLPMAWSDQWSALGLRAPAER